MFATLTSDIALCPIEWFGVGKERICGCSDTTHQATTAATDLSFYEVTVPVPRLSDFTVTFAISNVFVRVIIT